MKRDKTIFEKWFSLSRHQRRAGAKELSSLISTDFKSQRENIISGNEITYTHGSSNSIEEHFLALREEFSGQSELCYTHAKIIVLIRREFEVDNHFKLFKHLWLEEKEHLLKSLNIRFNKEPISRLRLPAQYCQDSRIRAIYYQRSELYR